jgi:hypothetical protein
MTRRRLTFGYALVAVVLAAGLLYLDGAGVFIYFSYVPVAVLVLAMVLGGVFAAGKVARLRRIDVMVFSVTTLLLAAVALACPFLPTSQRKAFFLAATSLQPGMSSGEARRRMAAFPFFESEPNSVTFLNRSDRDTVDVVVVDLTSDGAKVADVAYSPD